MTETLFSRLEPVLAANPIDGVLLTSPASLAYFAGYETQIESGAAPWLPCPAALLWLHGQSPVLFLAEGEDAPPSTYRSFGWARATGSDGFTAEAWLETGDSYAFTPAASIRAVEETLAGSRSGALSPAGAFGADFAFTIQDTKRIDAHEVSNGLVPTGESNG